MSGGFGIEVVALRDRTENDKHRATGSEGNLWISPIWRVCVKW